MPSRHTAAETLRRGGHEVFFHDLCAERFDPLLPAREFPKGAVLSPELERHCREIAEADGIIIVHPNWWGQPPAILKGWIDRVIRPGVAYEFLEGDQGEGVPVGLLKAKAALVFNTSNTEPEREKPSSAIPSNYLEKLHLRPLRRAEFLPADVHDHRHQFPGAKKTVAPGSRANCGKAFSGNFRRSEKPFVVPPSGGISGGSLPPAISIFILESQ